jgi:hypothetical protein
LACLCVGLLLSSAVWLIGSLAASVLAGFVIYRPRASVAISRLPGMKRTRARHSAGAAPLGTRAELGAGPRDPRVWVVDGRPRYHRRDCQLVHDQHAEPVPLTQAREDGFIACSLCAPVQAVIRRPNDSG